MALSDSQKTSIGWGACAVVTGIFTLLGIKRNKKETTIINERIRKNKSNTEDVVDTLKQSFKRKDD